MLPSWKAFLLRGKGVSFHIAHFQGERPSWLGKRSVMGAAFYRLHSLEITEKMLSHCVTTKLDDTDTERGSSG